VQLKQYKYFTRISSSNHLSYKHAFIEYYIHEHPQTQHIASTSTSQSKFSFLKSFSVGKLFFKGKEWRILMPGIDAAGKTTILYKLKVKLC
jgi:hypothetical protein